MVTKNKEKTKVDFYNELLLDPSKDGEWIKESYKIPDKDFFKSVGIYLGIKTNSDLIKVQNFIKNNIIRSNK